MPGVFAVDAACVNGDDAPVLSDRAAVSFFLECGGLYVVRDGDRVGGFALVVVVPRMHGERNVVWIEHIAVEPSLRRRGLATKLLETIAEAHPESTLHAAIHPMNGASLSLFRSVGASVCHRVLAYVAPKAPGST